jgi:hypothetical protein
MENYLRAGRTVAALIIVQMAGSYVVNFVLSAPLFEPAGFLETAASHARQIAESALLGIAMGGIWLAIAITMFSIVRRRSEPLALALIALATVCLAISVVEHMNVMSMLTLSEAYAKASVADREHFQLLRVSVAASRNWAHFTQLILSGCTMFVMYVTLLRFSLVPRLIPALGVVAVLLQVATVARPYFGESVVFPMLAPLGLTQLALALWLMVRGFRIFLATPLSSA